MPTWLASRFSLLGFIVVLLQQIPGVIWALHPPKIDPFSRNSGPLPIEVLEKSFGVATILMLVVVPLTVAMPSRSSPLVGGGTFAILAAYYLFYVLYYLGFVQLPILLGMAAFPPLAFLLAALYQGNCLAIITSLAFGTVHVGLTYRNFGA